MSSITPLPTPPSRNDPETFADRADALLSALPTMVAQTNIVTAECNSAATQVTLAMAAGLAAAAANASTATAQAAAAATSAGLAAAAWTAALAANPDLNPAVRMNPASIATDTTIPSGYNAASIGPIVVAESTTITVNDHATWSIL